MAPRMRMPRPIMPRRSDRQSPLTTTETLAWGPIRLIPARSTARQGRRLARRSRLRAEIFARWIWGWCGLGGLCERGLSAAQPLTASPRPPTLRTAGLWPLCARRRPQIGQQKFGSNRRPRNRSHAASWSSADLNLGGRKSLDDNKH